MVKEETEPGSGLEGGGQRAALGTMDPARGKQQGGKKGLRSGWCQLAHIPTLCFNLEGLCDFAWAWRWARRLQL